MGLKQNMAHVYFHHSQTRLNRSRWAWNICGFVPRRSMMEINNLPQNDTFTIFYRAKYFKDTNTQFSPPVTIHTSKLITNKPSSPSMKTIPFFTFSGEICQTDLPNLAHRCQLKFERSRNLRSRLQSQGSERKCYLFWQKVNSARRFQETEATAGHCRPGR